MDLNTLMSVIGIFGNSTGGATTDQQPRRYTPGIADMSQLGNSASNIPAPVAAPIAPQPQQAIVPAPIAPAAQTMPVHKNGFSTGNILTALLGSNFGQK